MRLRSAVLIALTIGLAACGDDPPTEEEWRAQAETLCVNGEMETMKTPLPRDAGGTSAFGKELDERVKAILDGLRDLDAPSSVEGRLEKALDAGNPAAISEGLAGLGLTRCASGGVYAFENGDLWAEEVEPACSGAAREVQAELEAGGGDATAQVADELRVLAKSLSSNVPPQEALPPWEAGIAELRKAASALAEEDDGRLETAAARGAAAFSLLNVEGCSDVYEVLSTGAAE